jgi:hypothetical protein
MTKIAGSGYGTAQHNTMAFQMTGQIFLWYSVLVMIRIRTIPSGSIKIEREIHRYYIGYAIGSGFGLQKITWFIAE